MILSDYAGIFIYFGLMVFTGVAMVVVSHLCQIKSKHDKYDWTRPYECGIRTEGLTPDRYPIHYYLVGILFVIFDVETVFFVPWAVAAHDFRASDLQSFWLLEMLVFLGILIVGYVYILQRGVLNWGQEGQDSQEVRR
jgi:NADH-quinone oxidoreductase subunit A